MLNVFFFLCHVPPVRFRSYSSLPFISIFVEWMLAGGKGLGLGLVKGFNEGEGEDEGLGEGEGLCIRDVVSLNV